MSGIVIDQNICRGCGLCIKACSLAALCLEGGKAIVDLSRCVPCGICVQSCPFHAIRMQQEDAASMDVGAYKDIWVFAEQEYDVVLPVAYELLGAGRALADTAGCALHVILLGDKIESEAEKLIAAGADDVVLCADPAFLQRRYEYYADAIAALCAREKPAVLLFGATEFGRSLAPRLAARFKTGLTADCTGLDIDDNGRLLQTRPALGGNILATIVTKQHRPQMATVRPGVMAAPQPDPGRCGTVRRFDGYVLAPHGIQVVSQKRLPVFSGLTDAKVIVSVGRGIGAKENIALAQELARRLHGSLGVSRKLVDLGWAQYHCQIGQTGVCVAPTLLIACGISGAIQHIAGIAGAQTIVAVNTDPHAAIFDVADYKIVGDCLPFLRAAIAALPEKSNEVRLC